jgi:hypothetical protein
MQYLLFVILVECCFLAPKFVVLHADWHVELHTRKLFCTFYLLEFQEQLGFDFLALFF